MQQQINSRALHKIVTINLSELLRSFIYLGRKGLG